MSIWVSAIPLANCDSSTGEMPKHSFQKMQLIRSEWKRKWRVKNHSVDSVSAIVRVFFLFSCFMLKFFQLECASFIHKCAMATKKMYKFSRGNGMQQQEVHAYGNTETMEHYESDNVLQQLNCNNNWNVSASRGCMGESHRLNEARWGGSGA